MSETITINIDYKDLCDEVYRDLSNLTVSFKLNIENIPDHKVDAVQKEIKKKLNKNYLTEIKL